MGPVAATKTRGLFSNEALEFLARVTLGQSPKLNCNMAKGTPSMNAVGARDGSPAIQRSQKLGMSRSMLKVHWINKIASARRGFSGGMGGPTGWRGNRIGRSQVMGKKKAIRRPTT